MEGEKVWKWAEDFFYLFIFWLSLFKTTEICLESTKMDNFTRKNHISRREKIGENYFALSEKHSSYAPVKFPDHFKSETNLHAEIVIAICYRYWYNVFMNYAYIIVSSG